MPMILVVDDSKMDRVLISELLRREPLDWLVDVVESAERAIEQLHELAYDVVITDVLMTGMSGLELLSYMHKQPRKVPVIVISGQGDESSAVEALRQGAASYVPKAELSSRLNETVKQVLEATETEQSHLDLLERVDDMHFSFRFPNDPSLIAPLVRLLQQMAAGMELLGGESRTRLGIAIDEAVINAMFHGNLELPAGEIAGVRASLRNGETNELLENRRTMEPYNGREVYVLASLSTDLIKISVRDEGSGFPLSTLEDDTGGHRGLTLIQHLMDELSFNPTGNEITLIKYRDKSADGDTLSPEKNNA